jgi:hypothetical protein
MEAANGISGNHVVPTIRDREDTIVAKNRGWSVANFLLRVMANKGMANKPLEITEVWPMLVNGQKRNAVDRVTTVNATVDTRKECFLPDNVIAENAAIGERAMSRRVML